MTAPCEVEDIEHLDAAQVIIAARQAATLRQMCDEDQRQEWDKRFGALMAELQVARIIMREKPARPRDDTPDFLKPDGPPLPSRMYLRRAEDALYHD